MIKMYFKIAWRNLMNNKVFSFINIFGLTVGLTSCMLISLYIINELSYDRYHKNIRNLYQLGTVFIDQGKEDKSATTPAPMGETMKQEFPEIQETARLLSLFVEDKTLFQYRENKSEIKAFYETRGFLTDPSFFKLFSYDFIEGNPQAALKDPNTIVLSEEIAKKIFGNQSALSKRIHISSSTNGDYDFTVTGVFRPVKAPSHIDARFFMSFAGGNMDQYMRQYATDMVNNNMFHTYFLLKPGSDPKKLEAKFPAFIKKHAGKELKARGRYKKQFLTPLKDIHLNSGVSQNVTASGSVTYLYILASVALFTLLIACINFMNLSTARSSKRSAEVGVRKVLGAEKSSLIKQFLGESLLMSFVAFVFAVAITLFLLPAFNQVSGKTLSLSFNTNFEIISGFLVLTIITGLLAGSYPAFYLSSFKPIRVLKGRVSNTLAAISLRKGLVVFQFIISVVLIIASVVISNQMHYMRSTDLGFNKERQIVIPLRGESAKNIYRSLKNEISVNPQVNSIGASLYYPGIFNPSDNLMYKEGSSSDAVKSVKMNYVDVDFLKTLEIKPVAGRVFSEEFPADTNSRIVLNEKAVNELGFPSAEQSVGKRIMFDWQGQSYGYEIVGVVKDFHFEDLHSSITPFGFQLNSNSQFNYLIVHAKAGDMAPLLNSIKISWHKFNPNQPFEYSFLDQDFQKNYLAEIQLSSIVGYFTFVAILISCLGLFGLATFSAEQRTKEIGVRKVLGASVASIVTLLSKDFLKLVIVAIIIASPIAWYVMHQWLQEFAYKISISWDIFFITSLAALCIALFTISSQAIKAALSNPVKSLRTE